ncbi:unnamed protein product [Discosporangium mesarthrocarpum]
MEVVLGMARERKAARALIGVLLACLCSRGLARRGGFPGGGRMHMGSLHDDGVGASFGSGAFVGNPTWTRDQHRMRRGNRDVVTASAVVPQNSLGSRGAPIKRLENRDGISNQEPEEEPWPIRNYDGNRIEEHYGGRAFEVLQRFLRIGPPAAAWYVREQLDKRLAGVLPKEAQAQLNEQRAKELREVLVGSGSVTFIKSGQAMSLRGDLVKNREYVRELEKLQVSFPLQDGKYCSMGRNRTNSFVLFY